MTDICELCGKSLKLHTIMTVEIKNNDGYESRPIGWGCPQDPETQKRLFTNAIAAMNARYVGSGIGKPTGRDLSKAIHILRGKVCIIPHEYVADPFSGAGNCWCGRDSRSSLHA